WSACAELYSEDCSGFTQPGVAKRANEAVSVGDPLRNAGDLCFEGGLRGRADGPISGLSNGTVRPGRAANGFPRLRHEGSRAGVQVVGGVSVAESGSAVDTPHLSGNPRGVVRQKEADGLREVARLSEAGEGQAGAHLVLELVAHCLQGGLAHDGTGAD